MPPSKIQSSIQVVLLETIKGGGGGGGGGGGSGGDLEAENSKLKQALAGLKEAYEMVMMALKQKEEELHEARNPKRRADRPGESAAELKKMVEHLSNREVEQDAERDK
jgi:hypothetical protein